MKLSQKDKIYLAAGGAALLIWAVYLFVVTPIYDGYLETKSEIATQSKLLSSYNYLWDKKTVVETKLKNIREKYKAFEEMFLKEKNQSLAAAELQKILEDISAKSPVEISNSKVLGSKRIGPFEEITIQLSFKSSMNNLKRFLFLVESSEKYLHIEEIGVRALKSMGLEKLESRVRVSGYIKSPPEEN